MKNLFKKVEYKKENTLTVKIRYKKIETKYIDEVIDHCKGSFLSDYLQSYLKNNGSENKKYSYVPEYVINIVLHEIKRFKETGKWR